MCVVRKQSLQATFNAIVITVKKPLQNLIVITVKEPLQNLTLPSQLLQGNTKIGYEALHLLNQECRKPRCGKETKAGHNSMSLKEEQEEEEELEVQ